MNGDESFNGPNVVPLRTILRKFLSLVDNYEARRNGGLDSYDSEFQELKQFSENLKADPDHVCREGERNVNRKKNRYKDILPYDFSRVILSDYGDVPGSDYINANFIKGASGSSAYIACQGPLPHTVNEFWRMVVECEVQVIVMACNEQESGKHKCENYWVEEDGVEREFGQVTVWLKKCRNVCPDFLVRTMRIRFTNSRGESEERNVCQFHYSAWPDHGVPTKVRPLLDMVRLIRDCQTSETLPVLVHCSAGCGRTGTICAIDYVWGLLRLGRLTPEFSLFTLVRDMRSQRIAMVQTKDQYILVHRAVKELFQEQLKIIDAHPYANVDENGLPLEIKRELQEPTYETLEFKPPFKSPSAFLVDSDKKKNSDYADTGSSSIVVSVSNVNTHSKVNSNNNHNPSILPLPVLPPKTRTTDVPSSSPLSSTGSGSVGASGEESRSIKINVEKSLSSRATGSGSVRIANNNNSNSNSLSNGGHVLQSSSSSNEDRDEKEKQLLKNLTSTFTVSSSDSSSTDKPSTSNGNNPKSSHSNNPLRSALLRKPSISKLKSFFEKTPKEEKDKDVKKSGSTQLSRAKSDVSTRFHAFKDFTSSFTSRTPPPPSPLTTKTIPTTTTTASSSSSSSSSPEKDGSKLSSELSSKSTENTNVGILGNENHKRTVESSNSKIQMLIPSKKPAIPSSKPILSIKRSKSLKVPSKLTTTTINYQNNISGLDIGGISSNSTGNKSGKDKDKEVHHYHSQISNYVNSSSSGASGSSSGFSSTIADNPIKVCVKQVEIPKLQSVVSKSIKPEVLLATSTASTGSSSRLAKAPPSSQEYDYDIDDRSHLRSQKPMSTSSSSVFQLQQESFQPSNSLSSSPETKTSTNNGNSNSISKSNPLPSSRIHILKDNHNYANVIYGNSNSNHSAATSSSSNNNHQRSSSRSQTMEDIQNFPSSRDSNEQSNQRSGGGELKFHGKLKKCDTVNPRILAASLGYTIPGHERSSILTRSQSHVWQPEKLTSSSSSHLSLQQQQQTPHPHQQQQSLPVRVFSSDNIHQPSAPPPPLFSSLSMSSNSNDRNRNSSSPSKTISMGTGSGLGIDYPVIMRKPKHTSITTNQNHRKPIRESNNDDIVDSNNAFVQATSVIESLSPVTTSALASNSNSSNYQNHVDSESVKGYHSRESSLDKTSTFSYSQHSVNSNSNGSGSGSNSNGKPVVRRRVPKTNPYANYPACVTGSNSNFPYKLPKSNQMLNASGTGTGSGAEDTSTSGSSNNYNHIMSGNSSNNFGGYSNTPSNELAHTNHNQHYRKDSNSSIPILKPSYGGSIGNSSESSSNTETPRNSLPSTPTQSVDVLYPQLHRNNSNNSNPLSTFPSQNLVRQQQQQQQQQQNVINNNYESTSSGSGSSYSQNSYKSNPKSILKEQMLQQQQQQISHHIATPVPIPVSIETSEKSENLRNFHQLQPPPPPPQPPPLPPPTFSTSNNANSNPSSSHIPKISTVRIAVGVRERRNSFRQAVWKEAPNNSNEAHDPAVAVHETPRNLIPSQKYINSSSNFNNSVATPRNNNNNNSTPLSAASSSISQVPALPKIHQNYEPIWPESLSNHNYNHNQTNPFQAMPVLHPANSNSKAKMNNSYSNSNTFPHNENSKLNSTSNSKSNSIQDQSHSSQKSLQNPAFQTKVDEIKVMLAELDAPVGGKFPNKTNAPGQGSSGAGTTTSLKQQRSLRAPSRSQYQQQGLSCFTFKKPSSYESLVDQLHQEQEQQELEDSDEYQPLINNTGTSSSSMGSTTGIIGIGPSAASIRKDFLYHPPSMRDNVESTSTSRNPKFSRGPHAQANDYVTLRQCRTVTDNHNLSTSASNQNHNNSSNNSNHVANASRQSSSSSPDFPKKFSMNSSSSGSPLGSSSNTPVPPPRSKAKRGVVGVGGGQSSHSSSKSPTTNNYDRDFQTDTNNTSLSHPAWAASTSYNTKMNYYPMPINTVPNANMSTSNNSELPRPHHPYEEYHDVGLGLGPGQGQIQQNPRDHHSSGDDAGGNVNNSNSITTSTSPKAIIRALGLFQAKAANVRSRFANWTEAKDRSLGNANKMVHENGNGPPLDQSNGNGNGYGKEDMEGSKGDHIMTGAGAGGSGNLGSSRSENNQLPTTISGSGHILGRSKHQYL